MAAPSAEPSVPAVETGETRAESAGLQASGMPTPDPVRCTVCHAEEGTLLLCFG